MFRHSFSFLRHEIFNDSKHLMHHLAALHVLFSLFLWITSFAVLREPFAFTNSLSCGIVGRASAKRRTTPPRARCRRLPTTPRIRATDTRTTDARTTDATPRRLATDTANGSARGVGVGRRRRDGARGVGVDRLCRREDAGGGETCGVWRDFFTGVCASRAR